MKFNPVSLRRLCLLLPLAACLLFSHKTNAQCKHVRETTDAFTKQKAHAAALPIGNKWAGYEVFLQESGGKFATGLRIMMQGEVQAAFAKGNKISFMLSNDKLLEVEATRDFSAQPITMLDIKFSQWIVTEVIPVTEFQKLQDAQITAVKYELNGETYLLGEITDKQTRKIMETADCMIKNTQ